MRELDPLQTTLVRDLHKILSKSKLIHEYWHIVADSDREAVENAYLDMVWQMIFSAAHARGPGAIPQPELENVLRTFDYFVKQARKGKTVEFYTPDWVAVDRATFEKLKAQSKE